jgi:hypothetical protein
MVILGVAGRPIVQPPGQSLLDELVAAIVAVG